MSRPLSASPLRRIAQQPAPPADEQASHCDLCAEPLGDRHRHLLELATADLSCACQACAILFDHSSAGGGRYRLVRSRPRKLDGFVLDEMSWAGLGIPVDLAFFVRTAGQEVTATYPNPAGLMRATVDAQVWHDIESDNAELAAMDSDVEALLVNRLGDRRDHWRLPIDECYRLVAVLRTHWTGFHGGAELWRRVDLFFDELPHGSRERDTLHGKE